MASGRTGCTVLGVIVHDDDIMSYVRTRDGKAVDSYNSNPGYFDDGDDTPAGAMRASWSTLLVEMTPRLR